MATHFFLLTYSVSPCDPQKQRDQNHADSLRQKLNRIELDDWKKLESVETAFSGMIRINEAPLEKKREEAQEIVSDKFKEVMRSLDAFTSTRIKVALMVQGLGDVIEFDF